MKCKEFECDYFGPDDDEIRDEYCMHHWRIRFGHWFSITGPDGKKVRPYCERCKISLIGVSPNDRCVATVTFTVIRSPKELLQFLEKTADVPVEQPVELKAEDAMELVGRMCTMIPPCPECGNQGCVEWLEKHFTWVMKNMLGPTGYMRMFVAMMEREGGTVEVTREEMKATQEVTQVTSDMNVEDQSIRATIVGRRGDKNDDDEESIEQNWPDYIN